MCGILCCVTYSGSGPSTAAGGDQCQVCSRNQNFEKLSGLLKSRGPDISSEKCCSIRKVESEHVDLTVHLAGHVLWTQGSKPHAQPYSDYPETVNNLNEFTTSGCHLLFNGDIYDFGDPEVTVSADSVIEHNDGLRLFKLLQDMNGDVDNILEMVSKLRGPFAFVYYDSRTQKLWFARDFFGRESLLLSYRDGATTSEIILSSVSTFNYVFEIPTSGVFCFDLMEHGIMLYPWDSHVRVQIAENTIKFEEFLLLKDIHLSTSCEVKLPCIPTRLKPLPNNYEEDEVLQALIACSERSIENETEALHLLSEAVKILEPSITQFLEHLRNSIRRRVNEKPVFCKHCIKTLAPCSHSKAGILFSGGLDSMVLACLTAQILEPGESLDLLNVAFFQDAQLENEKFEKTIPDRQTGIEAYKVLKQLFSQRDIKLNFIPVNVPKFRVEELRKERISYLIQPLDSVLDDSLGCCLWFAAAAEGSESSARIILLGSGADELLGGYGRHRSAYEKGGWNGLIHEMQLELDRISVRNLGRDNRVVSDSGVAPRLPFLDENVIEFLTQDCSIWTKCFPVQAFASRGLGEKLLLRATAFKLLGRENSHLALFPKRAMQFGSRIAKLENSKEKGGDQCARLTTNFKKL